MSRQVIPVQAVPNQTLQVQLNGQACIVNIYQLAYGLFVDLYVGNSLVVCGVIAENLNRIVRSTYLGLAGDLVFADLQGSDDPIYTGLGTRFLLLYIDGNDIPASEG